MWASDFDPVRELAAVRCPRCGSVGFAPVGSDEVQAVPHSERLPEYMCICPSVACRCRSCGAVGEWPNFLPRDREG